MLRFRGGIEILRRQSLGSTLLLAGGIARRGFRCNRRRFDPGQTRKYSACRTIRHRPAHRGTLREFLWRIAAAGHVSLVKHGRYR